MTGQEIYDRALGKYLAQGLRMGDAQQRAIGVLQTEYNHLERRCAAAIADVGQFYAEAVCDLDADTVAIEAAGATS